MLVYLSKPGGTKEGPFTLHQINQALALGQMQGGDYWAWYEGVDNWVPLYSVPGVAGARAEAGERLSLLAIGKGGHR